MITMAFCEKFCNKLVNKNLLKMEQEASNKLGEDQFF